MRGSRAFLFIILCPLLAKAEDAVRAPAAIPKLDRAYVSDRPGVTDNPHSMEAGGFRVESSVVGLSQSHAGTSTTATQTFGNLAFIGALDDSTELQVAVDSIVQKSFSDGSLTSRESQVGDSTIKIKRNLYGNDGGEFAVAVLPHVTFLGPLSGGTLDGGLSVAMSYLPTPAWAMTLMPQYNFVHDSSANRVQQVAAGLLVAREISTRWWGVVQYSARATEHSAGLNNAGFGAAYTVNSRLQIDALFDFQVKSESPDSNFSCGFTYRF